MRRHQLSATIDAETYDELDRVAEREGESRSEIVNRLLEEALEQRRVEETVQAHATVGAATAGLVLFFVVANVFMWAGL